MSKLSKKKKLRDRNPSADPRCYEVISLSFILVIGEFYFYFSIIIEVFYFLFLFKCLIDHDMIKCSIKHPIDPNELVRLTMI
jgi:hypothetical protein